MNPYNTYEVTQLTVMLPNQPGILAKLTTWLSGQGINLWGMQSKTQGAVSLLSFVPQTPEIPTLITNLKAQGYSVFSTPAFAFDVAPEKGSLDGFLKHIGTTNIRDIYGTAPVANSPTRIVFTVDNPELFRTQFMTATNTASQPVAV